MVVIATAIVTVMAEAEAKVVVRAALVVGEVAKAEEARSSLISSWILV